MKGIHCFSTTPMFYGRDISGYTKEKFEMLDFPDYMLGTLLLSAKQWKKTNGPITLYTDKTFYKYLEQKDVLDFWDNVSCELEDITKVFPKIDHAVFWSAAKFYSYMLEETPFVCVDTDMIVWKKLFFDEAKYDLIFTHWESIEKGDTNYVSKDNLNVSSEYIFLPHYEKVKKGLNMSLTALLNEGFKNTFTEEAVQFMHYCNKKFDHRYATPEILYMEQIIPVQLGISNGYKMKPFLNCTWSPKQFRFIQQGKESWIFNSFDANQPFMHLWFHKNYLEKNQPSRTEYINSLLEKFKENFSDCYDRVEKILIKKSR